VKKEKKGPTKGGGKMGKRKKIPLTKTSWGKNLNRKRQPRRGGFFGAGGKGGGGPGNLLMGGALTPRKKKKGEIKKKKKNMEKLGEEVLPRKRARGLQLGGGFQTLK